MWLKAAQVRLCQGVGGGVVSRDTQPSGAPDDVLEMMERAVNRPDTIGGRPQEVVLDHDGNAVGEGPATQSTEARLKSPYHADPQFTTMEAQLKALRHEGVGNGKVADAPQNMLSTEQGKGEQTIRGHEEMQWGSSYQGGDRPFTKNLV